MFISIFSLKPESTRPSYKALKPEVAGVCTPIEGRGHCVIFIIIIIATVLLITVVEPAGRAMLGTCYQRWNAAANGPPDPMKSRECSRHTSHDRTCTSPCVHYVQSVAQLHRGRGRNRMR